MSWRLRKGEQLKFGTPIYGATGQFSIKMHHGGLFCNEPKKMYVGGAVHYFDFVDFDHMSLTELSGMLKEVGVFGESVCFYHRLTGLELEHGLKILKCDNDVLLMQQFVPKNNVVEIYVEKDFSCATSNEAGKKGKQAAKAFELGYIPRGKGIIIRDGPKGKGKDEQIVSEPQGKGKGKCEEVPRKGRDKLGSFVMPYSDVEIESEKSSECESFKDSEYDSSKDDLLFDSYIDVDAEYAGLGDSVDVTGKGNPIDIEWCFGDGLRGREEERGYDSEDGLDGYRSENDRDVRVGFFNPRTDMADPKFYVGQKFSNHKILQDAVKRHSIVNGKPVVFTKQARFKVRAVCRPPCSWVVYASQEQHEQNLIVKTCNPNHICPRNYCSNYVNARWIANEYANQWKTNPKISAKTIQALVYEKQLVNVTIDMIYRARKQAMMLIDGSVIQQYARMFDYAHELLRKNPGSTVKITTVPGSVEMGEPRFERCYICLAPMKEAFKHMRPFLSMDGCFLKSHFGGQLLACCGIDPNNNWFPLCWAVVESECRASWGWFLELMIEDLGIELDHLYTVMSDKQKGLIEAMNDLLPNAEHRFCVMHMFANMRTAGFKGLTYKDILWKAAKSTTAAHFSYWMSELSKADINAFKWLNDKPPSNWSRSHFKTVSKCDILVNNHSESFNSFILSARDKPILACLETIRNLVMTRLEENREVARTKWTNMLLCPKIHKEMEKRKNLVGNCIPRSAGRGNYQVSCIHGEQYSVDIGERTCTCRKWDLTGLPCSHAISCMFFRKEEAETYVSEFYKVATYHRVYEGMINPMDGSDMWPRMGMHALLPPHIRKKAGRPRKMRRRKEDEKADKGGTQQSQVESSGTDKLVGHQRSLKCGICKGVGHNQRSSKCPLFKKKDNASTSGMGQKLPTKSLDELIDSYDAVMADWMNFSPPPEAHLTPSHTQVPHPQASSHANVTPTETQLPMGHAVLQSNVQPAMTTGVLQVERTNKLQPKKRNNTASKPAKKRVKAVSSSQPLPPIRRSPRNLSNAPASQQPVITPHPSSSQTPRELFTSPPPQPLPIIRRSPRKLTEKPQPSEWAMF